MATIATFTTFDAPFAHAQEYENADFNIKYTDKWLLQNNEWSTLQKILLTSVDNNKNLITISLYDKSPFQSLLASDEMPTVEMNLDVLDDIVSEISDRCRANVDGVCWGFQLVDSKIVTISNTRSALVDYSAWINDYEYMVRLIIIPTNDSGVWFLKGVVVESQVVDSVVDVLDTFRLAKHSVIENDILTDTSQKPERWIPDDPQLILQKTLNINMIMIGKEWSSLDTARLLEMLPSYYDPIFTTTNDKVGVRYQYSYNFVSNVKNTEELIRVMGMNSRDVPVFGSNGLFDFPVWQEVWVDSHNLHDTKYRLVDALAVNEYISDNIINADDDSSTKSINLVFLNIAPDDMDHIQNYYITKPDRATGKQVDFIGLMGFDNYNDDHMFFFDMWAVPWIEYDNEFLYFQPDYMNNLYDCHASDCIANIVHAHTESAIYHILTPSFLYPVEFYDNYFLDVLLYLKPGGPATVTQATLNHFMNSDEILNEMEYLYPFAEWDMQVSIERKDLRGMSYDFKQELDRVTRSQVEIFEGQTVNYASLSSDGLKPYLLEWAQQRVQDKQSTLSGDTWIIPILIVIDGSNAIVVIDGNAQGIAPGMPDDESLPCCALAVANEDDVWEDKLGLDNLILHEAGHVMGLHHTFSSFEYGESAYNGYFNWYSSPMTYSQPSFGCGIFYAVFYDGPCGNAAASFTEFERNQLADARLASLLKKIDAYHYDNVTSLGMQNASALNDAIYEIKNKFANGNTLSDEGGALPSALKLHAMILENLNSTDSSNSTNFETDIISNMTKEKDDSKNTTDTNISQDTPEIIKEENNSNVEQNEKQPILIPSWIKNSAGWWAQDLITDLEFLSSIEYMIKHKIIVLDTQITDNYTQTQDMIIPSWIKNSAGWWAQDLLTDDEFVSSVEYLISNGMIQVVVQ